MGREIDIERVAVLARHLLAVGRRNSARRGLSPLEGTGFEPSVPRRDSNRTHIELASSDQPEDVELRASDPRDAAAIFIAGGDPMISRTASAASARSGLVRAMRPRIIRHSSSAIALVVMTAWMLDPAACAGMALGAPRVTLAALAEVHRLLTERGFRRSSRDDPTIVQEQQLSLGPLARRRWLRRPLRGHSVHGGTGISILVCSSGESCELRFRNGICQHCTPRQLRCPPRVDVGG